MTTDSKDTRRSTKRLHDKPPVSSYKEYCNLLDKSANVTSALMKRRADRGHIHDLYSSPKLGGTSILYAAPRVRYNGMGAMDLYLVGPGSDEEDDAKRSTPVTQLTIIQPHNIAVVVTTISVYLMEASELFAQLGEVGHE